MTFLEAFIIFYVAPDVISSHVMYKREPSKEDTVTVVMMIRHQGGKYHCDVMMMMTQKLNKSL